MKIFTSNNRFAVPVVASIFASIEASVSYISQKITMATPSSAAETKPKPAATPICKRYQKFFMPFSRPVTECKEWDTAVKPAIKGPKNSQSGT